MDETPKVHSKSKHKRTSSKNRESRRRDPSRKEDERVETRTSKEVPQETEEPSPQVTINFEKETKDEKEKFQKGILGYIDRQLKVQNGNIEPPRSPAQRSNRSRASSDKSPKHKRSKSESKRRRERKLQAAGEIEANEALMKYLKQCSDLHDASGSLSGDLEISENLDDRKVNRKTKSQRERKSLRLIGEWVDVLRGMKLFSILRKISSSSENSKNLV